MEKWCFGMKEILDLVMQFMCVCLMGLTLIVALAYIGMIVSCAIKDRKDKKYED